MRPATRARAAAATAPAGSAPRRPGAVLAPSPAGALATALAVAGALGAGGCAAVAPDGEAGGPGVPAGGEATALVPPGYGTLHQDDITPALRAGDLQVKVTPLAESVIRLTAPDTYRRLHGLAESHRDALARQTGRENARLFLVSFFSLAPDVPYEPEALEISSRGVRHRPLAIRPVTPGWGSQRLDQREALLAVYAFSPEVDLEADLSVEYQGVRTDAWRRILTDLQAERQRVRARAGIGAASQSRSYFRILR